MPNQEEKASRVLDLNGGLSSRSYSSWPAHTSPLPFSPVLRRIEFGNWLSIFLSLRCTGHNKKSQEPKYKSICDSFATGSFIVPAAKRPVTHANFLRIKSPRRFCACNFSSCMTDKNLSESLFIIFPFAQRQKSPFPNPLRVRNTVQLLVYAQHVCELMGFKSPFGGSV